MKLSHVLKKRSVRITAIILLCIAVLDGAFAVWRHCDADDRELLVALPAVTDANYNNYVNGNTMYYHDGRFAWINYGMVSNTLTIVDEKGNYRRFRGIDSKFQLIGDSVVFIDWTDAFGGRLCILNTDTERFISIAEHVRDFCIFEKWIIFQTALFGGSLFADDYDAALFAYDTETQTTEKLLDDPVEFFIHQHELYALKDGTNVLLKIDLQDASVTSLFSIEDYSWTWSPMMPFRRYLLYREVGDLCVYNTETYQNTVLVFGEGGCVTDQIEYIVDDENIYVSVQRTTPDGSIISHIEDGDNGLWRVDPETLEYEKMLSDVFWELYLVDGMLFGRKDDQIYRIDTQTFETEALLG